MTSDKPQPQPRLRPAVGAYLLSLLPLLLFFLANYIFNHQHAWVPWLPTRRAMYFFAVILPFGIILPSLALGWMIRRAGGNAHAFGATLKALDIAMMLVALAIGLIVTAFTIGRELVQDPWARADAVHFFIWLLMVSLAEVLVFIGSVFHVTQWAVRHWLSGRMGSIVGAVCAIVVSAVIFGLFHFSCPAPWNTWEQMATLIPVWLGVAILYTLTHSMAAAVVFYNVMAVIGFVMNDLTIRGADTSGLVLDGIAVVAAVGIVWVVGTLQFEAKQAQQKGTGTTPPGATLP